jgi:hypothetical protein
LEEGVTVEDEAAVVEDEVGAGEVAAVAQVAEVVMEEDVPSAGSKLKEAKHLPNLTV